MEHFYNKTGQIRSKSPVCSIKSVSMGSLVLSTGVQSSGLHSASIPNWGGEYSEHVSNPSTQSTAPVELIKFESDKATTNKTIRSFISLYFSHKQNEHFLWNLVFIPIAIEVA